MRLIAVALAVLVSLSSSPDASEAKHRFVGTWALEVVEVRDDVGKWAPSSRRFGNQPVGFIMYDSAGNMAGQVMRRDRPRFASERLLEVTPDEAKTALLGYVAYFGSYDVDEEEGSVTHHRRGDIVPNRVGVDAKRFYRFHGEYLTLTLPSRTVRFTWQRVR
jgi:hypothetical protein